MTTKGKEGSRREILVLGRPKEKSDSSLVLAYSTIDGITLLRGRLWSDIHLPWSYSLNNLANTLAGRTFAEGMAIRFECRFLLSQSNFESCQMRCSKDMGFLGIRVCSA
jgi:hypothetical protein